MAVIRKYNKWRQCWVKYKNNNGKKNYKENEKISIQTKVNILNRFFRNSDKIKIFFSAIFLNFITINQPVNA